MVKPQWCVITGRDIDTRTIVYQFHRYYINDIIDTIAIHLLDRFTIIIVDDDEFDYGTKNTK
jgi:hypothetical protein